MDLISLFCGPGGLDQGFRDAGFTTRLAYDNFLPAIETHNHNHPVAKALPADLSDIDTATIINTWNERVDHRPVGVIGGPPCQSFSVSNVHQKEDDPRHLLPMHYARILGALNDAYGIDFFVFENVPGLVTTRHIERFAEFRAMFEKAGFRTTQYSLNALAFNVAQDRQRVFIVGLNRDAFPSQEFIFPKGDPNLRRPINDVIGESSVPVEPLFFSPDLTIEQRVMNLHENHWCMRPRSRKFSNGTLHPGEIWGRSFRVLDWDQPSYTVAYGHREVHVHPNGKRRLSVFEAMLLQGFPREYVLKGTLSDQIRLVSEAVCPPVAKVIAQALIEQLGYQDIEGNGP